MPDLLSAASLLLAIAGVLYGLWYEEINKALSTELPQHTEDRQAPLKKIRSVLWGKSIPLTLASVSVSLVFLPPSINITIESSKEYIKHGIPFIINYDPIATSLVIVDIFATILAIHSILWSIKLFRMK